MNAATDDEVKAILETLDVESRTLIAEILVGDEAVNFFKGDVGRAMVGIAKQEHMQALLELETVAWWRRRRIKQLQFQAWRSRSFISWLQELVIKGYQASKALDEDEEGDEDVKA